MKRVSVETEFWHSVRRHGWKPDQAVVASYLISCPARTSEGLYRIPLAYIASDLSMGIEGVSDTLSILITDGFIEYDFQNEIVLLVNALKFDGPKGSPRVKGAISALRQLPDTPLLRKLIEQADKYSADFAKALHQEFSGAAYTVSLPPRYPLGGSTETCPDTSIATPSIPVSILARAPETNNQQPRVKQVDSKLNPLSPEGGVGGDEIKASPKSSTRPSVAEKLEAEFNEIWAIYPRKTDRLAALKAYKARRRERVTAEDLAAATANYAKVRSGEDPQFTKRGATFFGPSHPWRDYLAGGPGLVEASQMASSDNGQVSEASQAWRAYRRFIADQSVYEFCEFPNERMKFAAYETYGNWREMCESSGRERNEDKAVFLKAWDEFEAVNV